MAGVLLGKQFRNVAGKGRSEHRAGGPYTPEEMARRPFVVNAGPDRRPLIGERC